MAAFKVSTPPCGRAAREPDLCAQPRSGRPAGHKTVPPLFPRRFAQSTSTFLAGDENAMGKAYGVTTRASARRALGSLTNGALSVSNLPRPAHPPPAKALDRHQTFCFRIFAGCLGPDRVFVGRRLG